MPLQFRDILGDDVAVTITMGIPERLRFLACFQDTFLKFRKSVACKEIDGLMAVFQR